MRSIKVKIWDTKEKKWLTHPTVELIHHEKSWGNEFYLEMQEDWMAEGYDPMRYIFVESTGLFDKHGKEIFEGDIVIYKIGSHKVKGQVFWMTEMAQWCKGNNQPLSTYQKTTEIIGDIYQNPKLLASE